VKGGIRLPQVALSVAEYSAYGNVPTTWPNLWTGFYCVAGGSQTPVEPEALKARFPQARPDAATLAAQAREISEALVQRGFLKAADLASPELQIR
jgi:hypothetical protein